MQTLHSENSRPIKMFFEMFGEHLSLDDYMEFYSNRHKGSTDTMLRLDVYKAKKLATVVLEEYSVRGKLKGHVIILFPEPAFNVPIFMFQLGGNDTQSIALLDISPTLPAMDYGPLLAAHRKYRDLLAVEESKIEWVTQISSPYLLHRQYGPLDEDLFMEASREYLRIWIEHYYKPGAVHSSPEDIETATAAIRRYKKILHQSDPAHGIFSKAWGKKVADAFMYLETRDHPALEIFD
ncbi:MAG: hypothetical protein OEV14_05590 [Gammaproteobacteria bacterium]|nr:hypothetical protein [Gammaproteobacteria bacterium]